MRMCIRKRHEDNSGQPANNNISAKAHVKKSPVPPTLHFYEVPFLNDECDSNK